MKNAMLHQKFLKPSHGILVILLVLVACNSIQHSTEIQNSTAYPTTPSEASGANQSLWSAAARRAEEDQIRVMIIDQDGYLLAGGRGGLVRWNIEKKTPEVLSVIPASEVVPVVALLETEDEILWVGTFGDGIYRIDHEKFEKITGEDGLPSNYISSLAQSGDGMLWVDTSHYTPYYDYDPSGERILVKFDGQQWQRINGGGFYKLSASSDGSLWGLANWAESKMLSTYLGHYLKGQWSMEEIAGEIITEFEIAPDGTPWVATRNGVYYKKDSNWERIDIPWAGETGDSVKAMAISEDGVAWFGLSFDPRISTDKCGDRSDGSTEMGVYRFDGKAWTHFTTSDGLADDQVCEILIAQNGTVWVGTFDQGISRYDGTTWETYSVSQGSN